MAMSGMLGPLLVLIFTLSQAFRDVYFGGVFQKFDFFAVILLAFSLSTVMFAGMALVKSSGDFLAMRGQGVTILTANLTTAAAWSSFFFALTYLDPSIVNTIHSAMGPLTVVGLSAFGITLAKSGSIGRVECAGYAGILASVALLWWVVIGGHSGLASRSLSASIAGLALLSVSGVSITVSLLYCKRLQDRGVGAQALTAVRYIALILLAGAMTFWSGKFSNFNAVSEVATLSIASIALIVIPLYAFQVGIGRLTPLTAQVIRALGPVFVFALEQFDGRMRYSMPVLACIVLYSLSVIVSNLARGWRDNPPSAVATPLATQNPPVRG
jgi:drug/metabolite transporter (DMT)-like permease